MGKKRDVGKNYRNSFPKDLKSPHIDKAFLEQEEARTPIWCWDWMDDGFSGFHWTGISFSDLQQLLKKLEEYRRFTKQELIRAECHQSSRISESALKRLRELDKDDLQDTLWSFRITQVKRVWALWHGGRTYILWFDPYHQICPMNIQDYSKGKRK